MTERGPLILKDGRIQELPKGDTVRGADEGESVFKRGKPLPLETPDELRLLLESMDIFL